MPRQCEFSENGVVGQVEHPLQDHIDGDQSEWKTRVDGDAILSLRAQAFLLNHQMRDARRELDAAAAAAPGNFEARLVDVTWQMNNGQGARGMQQLAVLLKEYGRASSRGRLVR